MNKLFDFINIWSEKLALRALRLSGASDESIRKYSDAVLEKDIAFISANKEIGNKYQLFKMLGIFLILLLGVFIGTRLLSR